MSFNKKDLFTFTVENINFSTFQKRKENNRFVTGTRTTVQSQMYNVKRDLRG